MALWVDYWIDYIVIPLISFCFFTAAHAVAELAFFTSPELLCRDNPLLTDLLSMARKPQASQAMLNTRWENNVKVLSNLRMQRTFYIHTHVFLHSFIFRLFSIFYSSNFMGTTGHQRNEGGSHVVDLCKSATAIGCHVADIQRLLLKLKVIVLLMLHFDLCNMFFLFDQMLSYVSYFLFFTILCVNLFLFSRVITLCPFSFPSMPQCCVCLSFRMTSDSWQLQCRRELIDRSEWRWKLRHLNYKWWHHKFKAQLDYLWITLYFCSMLLQWQKLQLLIRCYWL